MWAIFKNKTNAFCEIFVMKQNVCSIAATEKNVYLGVATDDAPSCEVPSRRRTIKLSAWQKDHYMF